MHTPAILHSPAAAVGQVPHVHNLPAMSAPNLDSIPLRPSRIFRFRARTEIPLGSPSGRLVSDGPPDVKTTPAPSSACRMRVSVPECGILRPISKSRIVASLRLDFAPSRTRDQCNSSRAARDCSAVRFLKTTCPKISSCQITCLTVHIRSKLFRDDETCKIAAVPIQEITNTACHRNHPIVTAFVTSGWTETVGCQ